MVDKFDVAQLKLIALALLEREIKNKERFKNPNFDRELLAQEIELSEITRYEIYDIITSKTLKEKMDKIKGE